MFQAVNVSRHSRFFFCELLLNVIVVENSNTQFSKEIFNTLKKIHKYNYLLLKKKLLEFILVDLNIFVSKAPCFTTK